jgi:hypothetical protein
MHIQRSHHKCAFLALFALGATFSLVACGISSTPTIVPPPQPVPTEPLPEPTPVPTVVPTPSGPKPSEFLPLDDTWIQYTNYQLGFTIKVPKTMVHYYGSCKWSEEGGDHSYRPEPAIVPVKVFEDGNTVYIASEYYYELLGETVEDGVSYFAECQAVTNSLELLQAPDNFYQAKWTIVMQEIQDDAQLDAFIKTRYGAGCSLGEKTPWDLQEGVFDVGILGDDKPMETTECLINYATVLKYYPEGGRVISWHLGQAFTFPGDVEYSVIYDGEMVDSFRFLTGEE